MCPPPDPGNVDIPGNNCDEDGDGVADAPDVCDQNLAADGPAADFAKSLGICQQAAGGKWGLVSATYTQGFGTAAPNPEQFGILPKFGAVIKPREGHMLGVISSGYAREYDDATGTSKVFKGTQTPMSGLGTPPPGYPKQSGSCMTAPDINDAAAVTLQIRVPNNAQGFQFDFDFFSGEWPEYVCTSFNDAFVAWLQSAAFPGKAGDLNISFDSKNNPVSVNNGFFDRCTPNTKTGCSGGGMGVATCPGGPAELAMTGFEDLGTYCGAQQSTGGGATGWLTTKAPVKGGEVITLKFMIWDTGDANWDSSVLVDNFQWSATPGSGTVRPPPQ
jgi:hypothetical protein